MNANERGERKRVRVRDRNCFCTHFIAVVVLRVINFDLVNGVIQCKISYHIRARTQIIHQFMSHVSTYTKLIELLFSRSFDTHNR